MFSSLWSSSAQFNCFICQMGSAPSPDTEKLSILRLTTAKWIIYSSKCTQKNLTSALRYMWVDHTFAHVHWTNVLKSCFWKYVTWSSQIRRTHNAGFSFFLFFTCQLKKSRWWNCSHQSVGMLARVWQRSAVFTSMTVSDLIFICGALEEKASYIPSYSVRWDGKNTVWLCCFCQICQGNIFSPDVLTQSFHFPNLLGISMLPFLICLILPSGKFRFIWVLVMQKLSIVTDF